MREDETHAGHCSKAISNNPDVSKQRILCKDLYQPFQPLLGARSPRTNEHDQEWSMGALFGGRRTRRFEAVRRQLTRYGWHFDRCHDAPLFIEVHLLLLIDEQL